MSKKVGFWGRIEKSRKLRVLFFCVSMIVLISIYIPFVLLLENTREYNKRLEQGIVTDYEILSYIDGVRKENDRLELNGWALRANSKNMDINIMLKDEKYSETIVFKTTLLDKKDIFAMTDFNWDFGICGFSASIDEKKLVENSCYEILLVLDYSEVSKDGITETRKKVSTGKYLYNGEIYVCDPRMFIEPQVNDSELRDVVQKGYLRSYDSEQEVYVYQYNNYIYWFFGSQSALLDGNTYMPFRIMTLDVDKLPEITQNLGYEYRDFVFETVEMTLSNENYRVAKQELPDSYAITRIYTGIYVEEKWRWLTDFQMHEGYIK